MDMMADQLVGKDKPLSSSSVIMLWAWPIAVAGSFQTLLPTLPFPLAQVVGGEKLVTSKDGVGEEEAIWTGGRAAASLFSSPNFLFLESAVRLDKGSFFKFLMQAYFSLLYLVAISAR